MPGHAHSPRLEPATLELDADGTARSPLYGDVYASRDGALGQARHVFLAGNDLPRRWRAHDQFTILETGFGLGTNFIATCEAWRDDPARCRRLHYVAIERHPVAAADLLRAAPAAAHESLRGLLQQLVAQWPLPLAGLHRLDVERGRIALLLAFGDVALLAPQLVAAVDAFYLDGFAPDRNPEMWSPPLFAALARLARDGATLATWSTARAVRDALAARGFELELRPGFASKRHMLAGRYAPRWRTRRHVPPSPYRGERQAIVVGAGLAGSHVAAALAQRDWSVTVLEARPGIAQGASALPWGLLHPQVSRDDNRASQLARAGLRYGLRALARAEDARCWRPCGVFELALDYSAATAAVLLERLGLPPELVRWCKPDEAAALTGVEPRGGGWWYPQGGMVAVPAWCASLLAHERLVVRDGTAVARLEREQGGWAALDADGTVVVRAPLVVVANALDAARLTGLHRLPLQAIGGRVSRIDLPLRLRAALAGDGTLLQADDTTFVGATYEPDGEAPLDEARAHAANVARLARLLATPLATGVCGGFAGIRCAARDRQPYVGAVADEVGCAADAARLQGAQLVDLPRRAGLYISAAFGSRGLLLAPLAAELIAAQAEGEPWPVERALAATLDPARYVLRQLRRPA